jgi:hypothetical protein
MNGLGSSSKTMALISTDDQVRYFVYQKKRKEKRREEGLWFDYCLFSAGSVDWTADIPIVANSFAV